MWNGEISVSTKNHPPMDHTVATTAAHLSPEQATLWAQRELADRAITITAWQHAPDNSWVSLGHCAMTFELRHTNTGWTLATMTIW